MPGSFQKMKNYVTGEDEDKGLVDELKDDVRSGVVLLELHKK